MSNNNNNYYYYDKRVHNVHYHDNRRHSSDNELHEDPVMSPLQWVWNEREHKRGGVAFQKLSSLNSFHIPKKNRSGDVPHKSPGNNALVEHEWGL